MALTLVKPSYDGATLHVDRDKNFTSVPDAESLSTEKRPAVLELIKRRLGIVDH